MPYSYSPHCFEDFESGQTFVTEGRTVTESDIVMHSSLSGDWTEFHTNEEYAKEHMFGERIAHGPLTFSISIGLMYRAGFLTRTSVGLVGLDDVSFTNPVRIGDTISVEMEVTEIHDISRDDAGIIDFDMITTNQDDEVVFDTGITLMLTRRETFEKRNPD